MSENKLKELTSILGISFIGLIIMLFSIIIAEMLGYIEIVPLDSLETLETVEDATFINNHPFHLWTLILIFVFYPTILITVIITMYCCKNEEN